MWPEIYDVAEAKDVYPLPFGHQKNLGLGFNQPIGGAVHQKDMNHDYKQ
jgi:hypothetical protein